jgi:hypothetical protein
MGQLHYPISNQDGCREYTKEDFSIDHVKYYEKTHIKPFILVDRGTCTFVTKTKHLQNIGMHLAIIADNRDEASDYVIMADDGNGADLHIPAFLISKEVG